jgi:hypothetical protein
MRRTVAILLALVAVSIVLFLATQQQTQTKVAVVVAIEVAKDGTVKEAKVVSCNPSFRPAIEAMMQRMKSSRLLAN